MCSGQASTAMSTQSAQPQNRAPPGNLLSTVPPNRSLTEAVPDQPRVCLVPRPL